MVNHPLIFLFISSILLTLAAGTTRTAGYLRTTNISQTNFAQSTKKISTNETFLECASACLYWEGESGICNAFSYESRPSSPSPLQRGMAPVAWLT